MTTGNDPVPYQAGLFDNGGDCESDIPRHQKHSDTSKAAAIAALETSDTQRARVFAFIRSRGNYGATDDECQDALDMNPSTQRPRRVELVDDLGVVCDSGSRRPTKSGRGAVVWMATQT